MNSGQPGSVKADFLNDIDQSVSLRGQDGSSVLALIEPWISETEQLSTFQTNSDRSAVLYVTRRGAGSIKPRNLAVNWRGVFRDGLRTALENDLTPSDEAAFVVYVLGSLCKILRHVHLRFDYRHACVIQALASIEVCHESQLLSAVNAALLADGRALIEPDDLLELLKGLEAAGIVACSTQQWNLVETIIYAPA